MYSTHEQCSFLELQYHEVHLNVIDLSSIVNARSTTKDKCIADVLRLVLENYKMSREQCTAR